jgi:hypothetical protein
MSTYLLIGGPRDGHRTEIPDDRNEYRAIEYDPDESQPLQYRVNHTTYRKVKFWACGKEFTVFAHESIGTRNQSDLFDKLLGGYGRNPAR